MKKLLRSTEDGLSCAEQIIETGLEAPRHNARATNHSLTGCLLALTGRTHRAAADARVGFSYIDLVRLTSPARTGVDPTLHWSKFAMHPHLVSTKMLRLDVGRSRGSQKPQWEAY